MPRVTWTHLIMDCPVPGQHYAVGQRDDGRWVFAWGNAPWREDVPVERICTAEQGYAVHARLSTALAVLRQTVEAHGDALALDTVRRWESLGARRQVLRGEGLPLQLRPAVPRPALAAR